MKHIILKNLRNDGIEVISCPDTMPANDVVEAWQRDAARRTLDGRRPPVQWKVAESSSLVDAIIESARF